MKNLTLLDQFALSLPFEAIPTLDNDKVMQEITGLPEPTNAQEYIAMGFRYQAMMRYEYAKAMLEVRNEQ